jgi:hypothetical protein
LSGRNLAPAIRFDAAWRRHADLADEGAHPKSCRPPQCLNLGRWVEKFARPLITINYMPITRGFFHSPFGKIDLFKNE